MATIKEFVRQFSGLKVQSSHGQGLSHSPSFNDFSLNATMQAENTYLKPEGLSMSLIMDQDEQCAPSLVSRRHSSESARSPNVSSPTLQKEKKTQKPGRIAGMDHYDYFDFIRNDVFN